MVSKYRTFVEAWTALKTMPALYTGFRLLLGYAALCVVIGLLYRKVLFPSPSDPTVPEGLRHVRFDSSDGVPVHCAYLPPAEGGALIVHFHGNGETLASTWIPKILEGTGIGVLLVEFRGYGLSHDVPMSEDGLYRDGEAAVRWAASQGIDTSRIILMGQSLGSGVAVELAARGLAKKLFLVTPYTSIPEVGSHFLPIFPMRAIMRERFDSIAKIKRLPRPLMAAVIHGTRDRLIPYAMGKAVAEALGANLITVKDGEHNNLPGVAHDSIRAALLELAARS